MGSDYDIKIKSLFDNAKVDHPDPAFTHQVMRSVRMHERRQRLVWLGTLVLALPVLWIITPDLGNLLAGINGFAGFTSDYTVELLNEAGTLPETWIFIVPFVVMMLYLNRRRFI